MFKSIFSKNTFKPYNTSHFLETKVFLFFIIFFCFAFQALSCFTLWTETELYPVHSSQYLFSQYANEFLFALKPFFYSILKLSFSISSLFDLLPMTGARFLFAFNGLAILALMYFYIKNKTNRYNAILAVLFLASMNIFLDRAFRVRSDLLSTSFSLICLLVNLNKKEQKESWKFYIIIPLLVSIFLISPKGIYWVVFTSILLGHDLKKQPNPWSLAKITATMFVFFYLLSLIFRDPFFITSLYQSAKFYLLNLSQTYHFILQNSWLTNLYELSHIGIFINKNLFLVSILCLKTFFILYSLILSKNRERDLSDLYFLVLIVILLFHPQQRLFFLSALSPFLCIAFFTDSEWKQLTTKTYSKYFKVFLMTGWFVYAFFYISYFNYRIYTKKNNTQQKTVIKELNTFYKNTDSSIHIFDPNCAIYTRKTICKYILYDQKFQDNFNSYIQNNSFDIILSSSLTPVIKLLTYSKSHFEYVNVKKHIYYKAFIIDMNDKSNFDFIKKDKQKNTLKSINKHNQILDKNKVSKKKKQTHKLYSQQSFKQTSIKNQKRIISKKHSFPTQAFSKKPIESLSHKQKVLSGKKILESLESSDQINISKQHRKYFYLYIDRLNRPLNKNTNQTCLNSNSSFGDSRFRGNGCLSKASNSTDLPNATGSPQTAKASNTFSTACKNNTSVLLQEGCYYSESELKKSFIPLTNKKIALFYLPFPFQLQSEKSLRVLLQYDKF